MTRFNFFTLFLTVIAVAVVAELLVNDYITHPDASNFLNANVFGEFTQSSPFSKEEAKTDFSEVKNIEKTDSDNSDVARITFGMLDQSGFKNVTLQRLPFQGILFEKIDIRDFKSVPVIRHNVLKNNRKKIAEFYELHAKNSLLANEIYLLIKEKAAQGLPGGINEVNDFGESSFYVNYAQQPSIAFLVVKSSKSVYALTYEKELHSLIEALLGSLS